MKETICRFGPDKSLFGILTTPARDSNVDGAPIAIILNAGVVHRIGPFRLHVVLARQLAEQGFSTLRMDLSGLGDSQPRKGKINPEQRAELDVRDAMDFLTQQTGTSEFVLIGLCSGAYNAHQVSVNDSRIVGAVFMDGIVFRTFGFFIRHYVLRMLRPRFWRNVIKRRWHTAKNKSDAMRAGELLAESEFFSDELSRDKVIQDLAKLLDRGVQMLFLYTDGFDDICGRAQFKEMYGFRPDEGQLQVEYYPKSEHTFRLTENRQTACDRVANWYARQFSTAKI
jgi:pimeloyl-ACP methyl ester carboxylesterase